MQIRSMLQKDLLSVAEIEKQCFSEPWSEKSLKESLESQSYYFLVAEEAEEVVGYMGISIILEEADVTNIAVQCRADFYKNICRYPFIFAKLCQ